MILRNFISSVTCCLAVLVSAAWAAPQTAQVKGNMEFVSDAPMEKIIGNAQGTGKVTIDFADLSTLTGEITVTVATMKTGNDRRDEHLRSAKWLDAASHPNITFVIKGVQPQGAPQTQGPITSAELLVTGDFTLHGVTKSLQAKVVLKWKDTKFKVTSQFQIALADYKVEGATGIVGSKVGKTIDIKVRLVGKSE